MIIETFSRQPFDKRAGAFDERSTIRGAMQCSGSTAAHFDDDLARV
jgi:hypothetical protein